MLDLTAVVTMCYYMNTRAESWTAEHWVDDDVEVSYCFVLKSLVNWAEDDVDHEAKARKIAEHVDQFRLYY